MFGKKQNSPRRRPVSKSGASLDSSQQRRTNVFSYRASRSATEANTGRVDPRRTEDRPAPPKRKQNLKTHIRRALKVTIVLLVIGLIGYNLVLKSDQPEVVVLGSGTYRDTAAYQQAVSRSFSDSVFNSNKVTVNVAKIEERLRAEFPELSGVSVRLPVVGHNPTVFLEPSTSKLILRSQGEDFVIDETGRAIATGDSVLRFVEAGLPEVQDQSQHIAKLGEVIIPSTSVSFVTEMAQQLRAKNVTVESIVLTDQPSELHLRIQGEGYFVKFSTRGDARVAVGSFLALKSHLEAQNKKPGEYVDVRIENRTFYR